MRIEKRNAGRHEWEEGYITSLEPELMVTRDCSMGDLYNPSAGKGMSWDDVRLLSAERQEKVNELVANALEEQQRQAEAEAERQREAAAAALQRSKQQAEAQLQLAQADAGLAVGTRIGFQRDGQQQPLRTGIYKGFKKNRTGANEHTMSVERESDHNMMVQKLKLKKVSENALRPAPSALDFVSIFVVVFVASLSRPSIIVVHKRRETGADAFQHLT